MSGSSDKTYAKSFSDSELRERLTPEQYEITQNAGTERAFTGVYNDTKDSGTYKCIVCDEALFTSDTKYDSGSGWPSFWKPMEGDKVETTEDRSYGMVRTEVNCSSCGAHLGHVFPDGPQPSGERYCMNSGRPPFGSRGRLLSGLPQPATSRPIRPTIGRSAE